MKFKQLLLVVAISAASAVGSVWVYGKMMKKDAVAGVQMPDGKAPVNYAGFFDNIAGAPVDPIDFTKASAATVPAVVHIKTKIPARKVSNDLGSGNSRGNSMEDMFNDFFNFGPQVQPEQRASGSGVIISEDGYIVTNNHVISDGNKGVADEITVTLNENKKTYKAKVIGRDPSSDIAVLKIDGNHLPYVIYGNSDDLKLGQWVLAVGYPLTLEATVTAGIVSAKNVSIGINSRQSDSPVESFIQTDAAVNQGNSGGALVNTAGQLVGINSAILAPNGTYAGYSFAIEVNIVKKIVNDLIEFGDVKRGYLGISYPVSDNEDYVRRAGIKDGQGVYALQIPDDGAAYKAGLKKGDVITKINNTNVATGLQMSAAIASLRPGQKVKLTYIRSGKEYTAEVELKGEKSVLPALATADVVGERLGVELVNLDAKQAEKYKVDGGVVVKKISKSGVIGRTRMEENFIITTVNGRDVKNTDELAAALGRGYGKVKLEGIYPDYEGVYSYQLNLQEEPAY
ncbi:MAG: PDZ domain-containing protein [Chitinophagaceae bacterium]|nr:MAG: PDZ domain-containing protein [Chitinophagaceae bacterium]